MKHCLCRFRAVVEVGAIFKAIFMCDARQRECFAVNGAKVGGADWTK